MISKEQEDMAIRLYRKKDITIKEISNLTNISTAKLSTIYRKEIKNGNLKPRNNNFFGNKDRVKHKFSEELLREVAIDYYEKGLKVAEIKEKWNIHPMQIQRMRNIFGETYGRKPNKLSKKIIQYTKDGQYCNEFESMYIAQKETGIKEQNISQCCNGKIKSAGGFVWTFK